MSEEKKTFNVKDRRMFTADGEIRRADADEAPPAPAVETPSEPRPSPPPAERAPEPPPTAGSPEPEPAESGAEPPVDFAGFLVSLATQAMQALAQQPPGLREARTLITILEMLKDKSEGRRTAEESDVVDALLYQLRMGYLERQRTGGA